MSLKPRSYSNLETGLSRSCYSFNLFSPHPCPTVMLSGSLLLFIFFSVSIFELSRLICNNLHLTNIFFTLQLLMKVTITRKVQCFAK